MLMGDKCRSVLLELKLAIDGEEIKLKGMFNLC